MASHTQSQLLVSGPQALEDALPVAGAAIKTILFHVHSDDQVIDRLQLVLTLARSFGAHVHCLHVTPIQAYTIVDSFAGFYVNQHVVDALEQESAKLQQRIEQKLRIEDVSWDYEETTDAIVPKLTHCAAFADLVITGREPKQREFGGPAVSLIGDLLGGIRTPLLVTGERPARWDLNAPAVIGWNGSYEAANAVRASVPLLKMASQVQVMEFREKSDRRFPSTRLFEYLSRHGIHAELELRATDDPIDEALVGYAKDIGAGLIVIGGYGHSRAGEFLFGGVTRALLKDCPIALLIAR